MEDWQLKGIEQEAVTPAQNFPAPIGELLGLKLTAAEAGHASVEFDADGKETSRMEVTKVEKKSVDDGQFAVPKDYAKVALPGM